MNVVFITCGGKQFVKEIKDDTEETVIDALYACDPMSPELYSPELEKDKHAKLDKIYYVYDPDELECDEHCSSLGYFYVTNGPINFDE